jgi:hypothetical protein
MLNQKANCSDLIESGLTSAPGFWNVSCSGLVRLYFGQ